MADEAKERKLDCALDMMRRMPPTEIKENLYDLVDVAEELTEDLLGAIDQPLETCTDPETGKQFLLCDYNRDADFYRSPWSNKYIDPDDVNETVEQEEYEKPDEELRKYEVAANEVFDLYRQRYYGGPPKPKESLSSVYCWNPTNEANMALCILFHNVAENAGISGTWDSIHVAEVTEGSTKGKAAYKLTTTVILFCTTETPTGVTNTVSGYRMQVDEKVLDVNKTTTHLVNIGEMVQKMENRMLNELKEVYFGKTQQTTNTLRLIDGASRRRAGLGLQAAFLEAQNLGRK